MVLTAHAKVNCSLRIGQRRKDGFHALDSVMQSVSLCDQVALVLRQGPDGRQGRGNEGAEVIFRCNQKGLSHRQNLAYRAAVLFLGTLTTHGAYPMRSAVHLERGAAKQRKVGNLVEITLTKNIPVGAGLAGGSADAAAVLVGLNRLYGNPFTQKKLCAMGASLGSDIPFCLIGGRARCRGRGEQVARLKSHKKRWLLLAKPNVSVATSWAYAQLDHMRKIGKVGRQRGISIQARRQGDRLPANDFEPVVLAAVPKLARLKEQLVALGFPEFQLSGSGPTLFCFVKSETEGKRALQKLRRRLPQAVFLGLFHAVARGVKS